MGATQENGRGFVTGAFSRRRLFWGAGGVVAAAALSESQGIGPAEIFHGLEIGYEYGPEVAQAVITHPGQSLEAYRLWRRPEREYQRYPFFSENLLYRRGTPNAIVGFGDSNLEAADGDGKNWQESPLHVYREIAQSQLGFSEWKDFNCAKGGYTTEMIIDKQVTSPKAKEAFNFSPRCDVWVNAGGNDVSALVKDPSEVIELRKLANDPFADMELLFKYTDRIEGNLREFGENFYRLLSAINQPAYSPKIRQIIIMSAPDFGRAHSIVTQEIDGVPYVIDLKSSAVRRLIENIAIRMNNAMFDASARFQIETGTRIIGINTATPEISEFSSNQHFSEDACRKIAETAVSRVDVVDS